jgi:hypothetical protein
MKMSPFFAFVMAALSSALLILKFVASRAEMLLSEAVPASIYGLHAFGCGSAALWKTTKIKIVYFSLSVLRWQILYRGEARESGP